MTLRSAGPPTTSLSNPEGRNDHYPGLPKSEPAIPDPTRAAVRGLGARFRANASRSTGFTVDRPAKYRSPRPRARCDGVRRAASPPPAPAAGSSRLRRGRARNGALLANSFLVSGPRGMKAARERIAHRPVPHDPVASSEGIRHGPLPPVPAASADAFARVAAQRRRVPDHLVFGLRPPQIAGHRRAVPCPWRQCHGSLVTGSADDCNSFRRGRAGAAARPEEDGEEAP